MFVFRLWDGGFRDLDAPLQIFQGSGGHWCLREGPFREVSSEMPVPLRLREKRIVRLSCEMGKQPGQNKGFRGVLLPPP